MYKSRYKDPRAYGNVYRSTRRCGCTACRCCTDRKYWHSYYYLAYTQKVDGKYVRRWEYIPKSEVRALRQRIRRTKARERRQVAHLRWHNQEVKQLTRDLKRGTAESIDSTIFSRLTQLLNMPTPEPRTELENATTLVLLVDLHEQLMLYL